MKIIFDDISNTPKSKFPTEFRNLHSGWEAYRHNLVIDDEVVGSVIIDDNFYDESVKLYCVEIFRPFRHNGYGKILLNEIKKYAIRNKLKTITLTVEGDNTVAYRLYKKFGFKKVDELNNEIDMVYKVKKLTFS